MGKVNITNIPDLKIKEVKGVEPIRIGQVAPAAVHIKELNHIDPISVDSLRIDQIRNLDPVQVERFDVTHLPTVNLTMSRMPALDVAIRRIPPIAVAVQQEFCLPSCYTVHGRILGIEFLRFDIHGTTMISPRDRVHRERSRTHERSFPDVAVSGNPGIPTRRIEHCVTVTRDERCDHHGSYAHGVAHAGAGSHAGAAGLSAGPPHWGFAASGGHGHEHGHHHGQGEGAVSSVGGGAA